MIVTGQWNSYLALGFPEGITGDFITKEKQGIQIFSGARPLIKVSNQCCLNSGLGMYAIYGLGLVNFANAPMTTLNQRKSPPKRKVTRGALSVFRVSPFSRATRKPTDYS